MYDICTSPGVMQSQAQLNQYIFLEKLGDGGMGEVWKGKHCYLDYEVAIKFLKPQFAEDADLQERFLNEGKRQARLDHPNIVRAIDFITDAGRHYLVMKYVPGVALDKKIEKAGGPLPLEEVISISSQVLSALDYAHSRGVIHRDVKPSNILIDDEGNAYLTDFGIALAVGQLRVTRTGSIIGTTYYMSPEQIKRPHDVDPSTDIYSFGVVLFEMLTGVLPFDAADGNDFLIKQAHVNEPPPKPSKLNPSIGKGVESVVLRALAKDPKDRWPNCEAMSQALQAASQSRRTPLWRTRPDGAKTLPDEISKEVSTAEVLERKRPSHPSVIPGISEVPPETWFDRNRPKVAFAACAILVTGGLGYTASKISDWTSHSKPAVQRPADRSDKMAPTHREPNEEPRDKRNDASATPSENSANSPESKGSGASKRPTGAQVVNQGPAPPKVIAQDSPKLKKPNPAAEAHRPDLKPPDIKKIEEKSGDATFRKAPEQIATGGTPLPPLGTHIVGDTGATEMQRPVNTVLPVQRPPAVILRPEEKEPPAEKTAPVHPLEKVIPASGTVTWSLPLKKGFVESLQSRVPSAGEISGEGLPGVPVSITITPPGIAGVVEAPAPSNGWKTLRLRGLVNARIVVSIQWKRL